LICNGYIINERRYLKTSTTTFNGNPKHSRMISIFNIKNIVAIYSLIIISGGIVTKLYGETCGFNLYDYRTWLNPVMMMGSPWCQNLLNISYYTNNIVTNMYSNITLGVALIVSKLLEGAKVAAPQNIVKPISC